MLYNHGFRPIMAIGYDTGSYGRGSETTFTIGYRTATVIMYYCTAMVIRYYCSGHNLYSKQENN